MWLPSPLYEKAPHYWLFLGLFLIVVGTYLGLEIDSRYPFLGVGAGLACCAWSVRTYWKRAFHREHRPTAVDPESAEQA